MTTLAPGERCDDGIDNDGDDRTDCADPDCTQSPACAPACPRAPTFSSITCRLAALRDRVESTPEVQPERARLTVQLTAASLAVDGARSSCAGSDAKGTRKQLRQAGKRMQRFVKRLRTATTRRTIPANLRGELTEAGEVLREDVKTLRTAPECPGDAAA
jgi:hypothetical protein